MKKPYNNLTDIDKENIIKEYYKGTSFKQIPTVLNISERSVSRVLKESDINTKRKNRYTLNESYFNEIDTEEKAYLLGLLYADGFVGDENFNNISISLKIEDKHILLKMKELIEFTGELRYSKTNTVYGVDESWILNFSSVEMSQDLRKLGLYPGKSTTMTDLPDIPEELLKHFARGYFDGDGSITISESTSYHKLKDGKVKVYRYPSYIFTMIGTESFIGKMKNIIPAKCRITDSKSENMIYLRCDAKGQMNTLFQYLYNDATIYLERKYIKWITVIGAINE